MCATTLIWNSNGNCRDGKPSWLRIPKANVGLFTMLTCAVWVDRSTDHKPALSHETHQVYYHPMLSVWRCKYSVCTGSSPSSYLGAQQWKHPCASASCLLQRCAANRELGQQPQSCGFHVPSAHAQWSRPEPLGHYGIQKLRAGKHGVFFTFGWVWFCKSVVQTFSKHS